MSQPLYDQIGTNYDKTRKADPFIVRRLASHLFMGDEGPYLDIACGTGNYMHALSELGGSWIGIDQSGLMLQTGKSRSPAARFLIADASTIPFRDGTFCGSIAVLAIHHFSYLSEALREAFRVMKQGRFVLFTSTPEQMNRYWLTEYFPETMKKSIKQMSSLEVLDKSLVDTGFSVERTEAYHVRSDLQDRFLYHGKYHPEVYLDDQVRRGISSFSSFADKAEIVSGSAKLKGDIKSGRIKRVIESSFNPGGDYLFVIAEKH